MKQNSISQGTRRGKGMRTVTMLLCLLLLMGSSAYGEQADPRNAEGSRIGQGESDVRPQGPPPRQSEDGRRDEMRDNNREIRQDYSELNRDRQELRQDMSARQELQKEIKQKMKAGDTTGAEAARAKLQSLNREIKQDRREINQDRRELNRDRQEARQDQDQRRTDKDRQEARQDRSDQPRGDRDRRDMNQDQREPTRDRQEPRQDRSDQRRADNNGGGGRGPGQAPRAGR